MRLLIRGRAGGLGSNLAKLALANDAGAFKVAIQKSACDIVAGEVAAR